MYELAFKTRKITGLGGISLKCDIKRTSKDKEENSLDSISSQSTIHGIDYIFDRKPNIVDCLLWLVLVIAFDCVAAALTLNFGTSGEMSR